MRYILNPNIALRSWKLVPYAYYIKGERNARGLKKEEFEFLLSCDGKTELPGSKENPLDIPTNICFLGQKYLLTILPICGILIQSDALAYIRRACRNKRVWRNWQTRKIQVLVAARLCRFNSCHPHHMKTPLKSELLSSNSMVFLL